MLNQPVDNTSLMSTVKYAAQVQEGLLAASDWNFAAHTLGGSHYRFELLPGVPYTAYRERQGMARERPGKRGFV